MTGLDQETVTISFELTVLTVEGDSGLKAHSKLTVVEKLLKPYEFLDLILN